MTREMAKEMLPIILKFIDGEKIEFSRDGKKWIETSTPSWNPSIFYRIKAGSKYRPFKSLKECWEEMSNHMSFGWIKTHNSRHLIYSITDTCIWLNDKINYTFEEAFNTYTFDDGTPFGIKED